MIGPLDSPPLALRWSIVMQRKSGVNASIALITAVGQVLTREFKPPGGDQQRKAGAGLLVADADVAPVIKRHGSLSLSRVVCCGYFRGNVDFLTSENRQAFLEA
jgi:hypothetical protein